MKISVALCTYNGEKFLKEQIDSILNQTLKVNEIVVCDDGSNDSTISILETFSIENPNLFKIIVNDVNLRSVKNFEKAIGICTGEIIFLSDQDDIWVNIKVEEYIKFLEKNPNIDVVASNGFCIDENSKIHEKYSIWDVPEFLREQKKEVNYFKIISQYENIVTGATMAFRKEIVSEIIPFPVIKGFHHDQWIAIISSSKGSFEMFNDKYFYYRIHEKQLVGGVFFDKSNKTKKMLNQVFDIENQKISLYIYKKRLKKLCNSYAQNKKLIEENCTKINFEEINNDIEKLYLNTKLNFKAKNPFLYYYISTTDMLFKKRQLEK